MHAANLKKSERLQRVMKLLSDGLWHSSFDIQTRARICSASTVMSELVYNEVELDKRRAEEGRHYEYRLAKTTLVSVPIEKWPKSVVEFKKMEQIELI